MGLIEAQNVKKNYGEYQAISGINMEVSKEQITGIIGPNGAGKSTLISVLTGQAKRDGGDVEVLSIDPNKKPKKLREKIGVLPEREDPPSFLTGEEYLEMVSDVRETEIDIDYWAKKLRLEGKLQDLTRDLSKGERQKLMVIQAFFHEPELVFVDEPLVNLDPFVQEEVKKIFKQHRNNGKSVMVSTHVVSLAEEICDTVYSIENGSIQKKYSDMEDLKSRFLEE